MKLKVKIAGPKVHDIGYRVFLLKQFRQMQADVRAIKDRLGMA